MTDEVKDIMKDLPVAQPERKPFAKADQTKVNDDTMPEHTFFPKGDVKVKSHDGAVEFDVSHK